MPALNEQLDQCFIDLSKCRQGFEKLQPDQPEHEEQAFAALCDLYAVNLALQNALKVFAGEPAVPFVSLAVLKRRSNRERLKVLVKSFVESGEKQGFSPVEVEKLRTGREHVPCADVVRTFKQLAKHNLVRMVEGETEPRLVRDQLYVPTRAAINFCLSKALAKLSS